MGKKTLLRGMEWRFKAPEWQGWMEPFREASSSFARAASGKDQAGIEPTALNLIL